MRSAIFIPASTLALCGGLAAQERVDPAVLDELDSITRSSTESENGWTLYSELLKDFQHPPSEAYFACTNVPGSSGWKHLEVWLNQNRGALPTLVTASRRARYGMSYHPGAEADGSVATVSLLHNRNLVNLLCVAAREVEAGGLLGEAIEYVHSAYRLGSQIVGRPTLMDRMVGLHLVGIASREARRLLVDQADALSTEQIADISTGPLLRFHPGPIVEVMRFEQLLFPEHYRDEERLKINQLVLQEQQESTAFQIDTTRAVFEIIRYRHATGRYPGSLKVLDPDVLGDQSRYRYYPPEGTRGLVLYALGEDGVDDFATLSADDLAAGITGEGPAHRLIVPVR